MSGALLPAGAVEHRNRRRAVLLSLALHLTLLPLLAVVGTRVIRLPQGGLSPSRFIAVSLVDGGSPGSGGGAGAATPPPAAPPEASAPARPPAGPADAAPPAVEAVVVTDLEPSGPEMGTGAAAGAGEGSGEGSGTGNGSGSGSGSGSGPGGAGGDGAGAGTSYRPPRLLAGALPLAPQDRDAGSPEEITARLLVGTDGRVSQVEPVTQNLSARVEDAVRRSATAMRFAPARRGQEPVPAWFTMTFTYRR